ncbi:SDR family NAD(P)-dependent oxidoreductase [Pelagovum pacificum]|uniref:SDR family NAD(P)-dependent oxidoreductase n=1 Tax=Pelagovum pacificum TaxID=2588711 RepID=A0A5C5GDD9_9RHOB|nr:SDR family NAD(P)-dependent oxidoreductase [Pelagovum pacificum]QQA44118.1 SDR family NAD(P)-dependent oxidoreductase [Pelagovum pacificum]TNY32753.1 SDR family NAD(P)-dependent oxidoreductase [Pelagovum pacificum]
MSETWIILGATSSIARVMARRLAGRGAHLLLCGRDHADMQATAADALARGAAGAEVHGIDVRNPDTFAPVIAAVNTLDGPVNVAVFVGSMPEQSEIDADPALIDGTIADSLTGPARFLHEIAPLLEERGGSIAGVGSVAGDRGRVTNYVYGAAKAGFAAYLSGLRNRMARKGVHVMTVKPGPVDTAMTWGMKMPLMTTPEAVADAILKGLARKRNVIYTAGIWRPVMMVIRAVPEPIFKKTSF